MLVDLNRLASEPGAMAQVLWHPCGLDKLEELSLLVGQVRRPNVPPSRVAQGGMRRWSGEARR